MSTAGQHTSGQQGPRHTEQRAAVPCASFSRRSWVPASELGFGRPDDDDQQQQQQQQPKLDADFIAKAKTGGSRKMILPGMTLREQESASDKQ